jgi:hypothetical protein
MYESIKHSIFGSGLGSVSLPINGLRLVLKQVAKIDMLVKKINTTGGIFLDI